MNNKINSDTKAEKALFFIDSVENQFEGYISGQKWNGWECPLFTKSTAERICTTFSDNDTMVLYYDEQSDCFIVNCLDAGITDEIKGIDIEIDGELNHLYPIGSFEWCWEKASVTNTVCEVEETEENEIQQLM